MELIFLSIIAPIISGCIITVFKYWLDNRNQK
ncbi:type I toxin-antitoxin system Fst family toxin [Staphylococcus petrasii]|nr:type I toxin-antitoxin system Fst family toxin [Staphylococcus petrasii]MCI2773855.1 type I toxin-antitoxin system Fst family toxin [Staphylococcus petrasii]